MSYLTFLLGMGTGALVAALYWGHHYWEAMREADRLNGELTAATYEADDLRDEIDLIEGQRDDAIVAKKNILANLGEISATYEDIPF